MKFVSRTRVSDPVDMTYTADGVRTLVRSYQSSSIREELARHRPRGWAVSHRKTVPYSGHWAHPAPGHTLPTFDVFNWPLVEPDFIVSLASDQLAAMNGSLNHSKLSFANEFGLVQFIGELDQSLALFTSRFWTSLSYGSVTWGILPFVQEMQALLDMIRNFENSFASRHRYSDTLTSTRRYSNVVREGGMICEIEVTVSIKYTGAVTYPFATEAQKWLDRLGFHPDWNSAWDLIPLSFVVDWVLPVGKFLQNIRSSGNVRQVLFEGWVSHTIEARVVKTQHSDWRYESPTSMPCSCRSYDRNLVQEVLSLKDLQGVRPLTILPSFDLERLFQLFYIFFLGRRT